MYQAELQQFRAAQAATLGLAEGLSEGQAAFAPGHGQWSAGEVLDHLLLTEQL